MFFSVLCQHLFAQKCNFPMVFEHRTKKFFNKTNILLLWLGEKLEHPIRKYDVVKCCCYAIYIWMNFCLWFSESRLLSVLCFGLFVRYNSDKVFLLQSRYNGCSQMKEMFNTETTLSSEGERTVNSHRFEWRSVVLKREKLVCVCVSLHFAVNSIQADVFTGFFDQNGRDKSRMDIFMLQ